MKRVRLPIPLLVAAGLFLPAAAYAQSSGAPEPTTLATAVETASHMATTAEQLRPTAASPLLAARARDFTDVEPRQEIEIDNGDDGGVPLMVAGGILFVAGAIAGGDAGTILMLGGAAAGAYGAFVYFGGD